MKRVGLVAVLAVLATVVAVAESVRTQNTPNADPGGGRAIASPPEHWSWSDRHSDDRIHLTISDGTEVYVEVGTVFVHPGGRIWWETFAGRISEYRRALDLVAERAGWSSEEWHEVPAARVRWGLEDRRPDVLVVTRRTEEGRDLQRRELRQADPRMLPPQRPMPRRADR